MDDTSGLQALGQQLTTALVGSYGTNAPGGSLVFLPCGVAVSDDIVQGGVLNPTQLATWLSVNFDYPFIVSTGSAASLDQDQSHGTASFIYQFAISKAEVLGGAAASPAAQVIAAEIVLAQQAVGEPNEPMPIVCEPDDWVLPTSTGYWSTFDSTQTAASTTSTTLTTTTPTAAPTPAPDPRFWVLRAPVPGECTGAGAAIEQPPERAGASDAVGGAAFIRPAIDSSNVILYDGGDGGDLGVRPGIGLRPKFHPIYRPPYQYSLNNVANSSTTVTNVTSSTSSSIAVKMQHQCVMLGRYTAGQSSWNGGLLASPSWYVPGFSQGGMLPVPAAQAGATYGLPIAMIVVQSLTVSGQWTQDALAALSAGGSVGPLSLAGAVSATAADGVTVSFSQPGMQVVALICTPLPVVPPIGDPSLSSASSSSTSPANSSPAGTSSTSSTAASSVNAPAADSSTSSTPASSTAAASTAATDSPIAPSGAPASAPAGTTPSAADSPASTTSASSTSVPVAAASNTTPAGLPASSAAAATPTSGAPAATAPAAAATPVAASS